MNLLDTISTVYFIGIGGIGMSALARFFAAKGKAVYGYDRTETPLTRQLAEEGMQIHYTDDVACIAPACRNASDTLVIFTPAVPADHQERMWFVANGFRLMKRAEVLGEISRTKRTIGIAGTHGKTTISTMTAHLLTQTGTGCDAFLGGISKNYGSNLILHENSRYIVAEADEFDRSFLHLRPTIALVSATDADHLDIYGTHQAVKDAFSQYAQCIQEGGLLIAKKGTDFVLPSHVRVYTYALDDPSCDCYARNITVRDGAYHFDVVTPMMTLTDVVSGVPGLLNVENTVAALSIASFLCCDAEALKDAVHSFEGVCRRFDYHIRRPDLIYIDDYGHHPEELRFTISSVRALYPGRHLTGIFQPHLYTRTRDFAAEFAESLSLLDKVILLEIYPAREEPIPGVTSDIILDKITCPDKMICPKAQLMDYLRTFTPDILLTMGAGNIDTLIQPITRLYQEHDA